MRNHFKKGRICSSKNYKDSKIKNTMTVSFMIMRQSENPKAYVKAFGKLILVPENKIKELSETEEIIYI